MPEIISLAGDWDIFERADLRQRLIPACTVESCIVDFTGFHCGDATFLDELVYMLKARRAKGFGPPMFVITPGEHMLLKVLSLTHLINAWPIFESLEAAAAAAEQKAIH